MSTESFCSYDIGYAEVAGSNPAIGIIRKLFPQHTDMPRAVGHFHLPWIYKRTLAYWHFTFNLYAVACVINPFNLSRYT